jgi:hypothetical protein
MSVKDTVRAVSRLFYLPSVKTVLVEPPKTVERPVFIAPSTTYEGYPLGKEVDPTGEWLCIISPEAKAKLDGWHAGSHHLELSGYAVLSEPPVADPAQDKVFYVEDMHLLCAIEESSGGYTNMPPDIRARFMMDMRAKGVKADRLSWWHKHPITNWSGTDVNTMRQRVHELGLPERLCAFSFVLTPAGIRARWDQANPDIYVDEIKVFVGTPETLALAQAAKDEAEALVATRQERETKMTALAQAVLNDKPAIVAPQVSWKKPKPEMLEWQYDVPAVDEEEFASLMFEEATARVIASLQGKSGDFPCAVEQDLDVDAYACVWCPYNKTMACHGISTQQVTAEMDAIREEMYG